MLRRVTGRKIFISLFVYTRIGKTGTESGSQNHWTGEILGRARFWARLAGSEQRTSLGEKDIVWDVSRKGEKVPHPQILIVPLCASHCSFH